MVRHGPVGSLPRHRSPWAVAYSHLLMSASPRDATPRCTQLRAWGWRAMVGLELPVTCGRSVGHSSHSVLVQWGGAKRTVSQVRASLSSVEFRVPNLRHLRPLRKYLLAADIPNMYSDPLCKYSVPCLRVASLPPCLPLVQLGCPPPVRSDYAGGVPSLP